MIVACYHPLPSSACMLHFDLVSILFGTSIPTSFKILVKMFLHFVTKMTSVLELTIYNVLQLTMCNVHSSSGRCESRFAHFSEVASIISLVLQQSTKYSNNSRTTITSIHNVHIFYTFRKSSRITPGKINIRWGE